MNMKIHAIKCPQCGSPEKEQIKEHYYQCKSCGTEYFIENNDVRHFHYHENVSNTEQETANPLQFNMILKWLGIAFVVILYAIYTVFKDSGRSTGNQPQPRQVVKNADNPFKWVQRTRYFMTRAGEPVALFLGTIRNKEAKNTQAVFQFYQPKTNTFSERTILPEVFNEIFDLDFKIESFRTGEQYLIIEEKSAYLIDTESLTLNPLNEKFMQVQPELGKGIIKIEFGDRFNNNFKVMLSNGKKWYYFPYSNLVMTYEEAFDYVYRSKNKMIENAPEYTNLAFSSDSMRMFMKDDDKIRLVEYKQKTLDGYPYTEPSFHKSTEENQKEITRFLTPENQAIARITSWRDITPGRDYYFPKLYCHNENYAVISFNENALRDSNTHVQLLDLKKGDPIWTESDKDFKTHSANCVIDASGITYLYNGWKTLQKIDLQGKVEENLKWD